MDTNSGKVSILILAEWFYPAFKAGGPITSCVNFVNACSTDYDIKILTSAYDHDGTAVVSDSEQSKWKKFNIYSEVYYASKEELSYSFICNVIRKVKPDFIYCNGMFSLHFTIFPLLAKVLKSVSVKIVLAPRGMLKPSALAYKQFKKRVYLGLLKLAGISRTIRFHATDESEHIDIRHEFGDMDIVEVGNFPSPVPPYLSVSEKIVGRLNILFLGRIHEIKQLHYLLDRLSNLEDDIFLTIVGPVEDADYWKSCLQRIERLPVNIKVEYIGEKSPEDLIVVFQNQHILTLPTKGENFGHAIFESFANGKPVIISDRTPWLNLDSEKTGFAFPLDMPELFENGIRFFAKMNQSEYTIWSMNAYEKAKLFIANSNLKNKYLQLFSTHES